MNAIIGMTELALRAEEFKTAREQIVTVKQAGANLLSIINDILDFSKIETGRLEIIPGDYHFSSLVNDVISIIRMRLVDSNLRFVVNIDSKIPNELFGDEIRIRQVLLNLLSNAVKYTDNGYVCFSVYGKKTNGNNIDLFLEVKDTGLGIKQEDQKNLFVDYSQFDHERNKNIEGTGLGLAITKNIVLAMKGEINVISEYRKGSTFTVRLPQRITSGKILASVEKPENKDIIIYERREIYADSIVYSIKNLGVNYTLVSSDSELSEKMSIKNYAFIFLSYAMYKKNVSTILSNNPKIKVVVLTEFGEAIPDKKLSALAMPVHSMSIADILNGVSSSFSYSESNELFVRFTAPEARILVVDDINTNLKVAEGLLLPYGMKIDLCKSGIDAIELVKTECYDLIFMDHKMPGMDGVETTHVIRAMEENNEHNKNVPIVALTANAVIGTREMFLESGFNDFLSKPIDTIKINAILEKWLPKEKQKGSVIEAIITDADTGEGAKIHIEIEGIDVKKGTMLSGGTTQLYLDTLDVYYKDGLEKLKEIKECLETDNLPLYTIHLHALKSASANIGASSLSEEAKALEKAGEQEDLHYIENNNGIFMMNLELLLSRIKTVTMTYKNREHGGKESINFEVLAQDLGTLKSAIQALNAGIINTVVDNLRELVLPENINAAVSDIADNILFGEYEKAVELIDMIIIEGKND